MSRSFTPPDTLSKQEIRTIADVRRDIWTNSFHGMGYGAATGVAGHSILSFLVSREFVPLKMKLNRNTATFTVLLCSSLGSFLAATTTGKNQVHNLHPIFEVGAIKRPPLSGEDGQLSEYQKNLEQAKEEDEKRLRNRILRRKTLKASLGN
mmetsp:Transcript_25874/g.38218  ORF Transcript_25874/g.38218 Transcript_25874/m.38218 type:complete len:151 (-) Transcript_25874:205-657(-)|eukprot:CAMPEP_0194199540 /NCGR_PEP_ID=MMETSP0156-20130528/526_1 /TAXON_ID=33649 /ORGANISM="Thalassionema nitzschioides, Strain L26-B" /LENGTH=150 /DNA_ID=CAMNT_0038924451 /DNA_START=131 /DNA_END=583 /DNA_ORIENTATION=+